MSVTTIDPSTGQSLYTYEETAKAEVDAILDRANAAALGRRAASCPVGMVVRNAARSADRPRRPRLPPIRLGGGTSAPRNSKGSRPPAPIPTIPDPDPRPLPTPQNPCKSAQINEVFTFGVLQGVLLIATVLTTA